MYREILLPTDGGPASQAAVSHAVELAEQYDGRLHILYVVDTIAFASLDAGTETVISALRQEGETALEGVAETAQQADVSVSSEIVSGSPYKQITTYATENDIDLIVMGTHGRTGLDRYLLGSVTERVVRTADAPVLTVRASEDES
jgi:nucleotide-binding universal stress UspA family protein